MTLRNIAAASLAALALAACGDDDDDNNTKPITPDTPATPEACKAMKCVYQTEGDFKGSFVAKNEKGEPIAVWDAKGTQTHKLGKDGKLHKIENKPEPGTAGEFDLSGEGVTEPLKEPVRGGSNYLRGSKATFDVASNKASISSIATYGFDEGHWNEAMDNFVAIDPDKAKEKGLTRALFEDIGKYNIDTAKHVNSDVFKKFDTAKNENKVNDDSGVGKLADYSRDLPSTIEMKITDDINKPFMANGSLNYADRDWHKGEDDQAWHQEEQDLDPGTPAAPGTSAAPVLMNGSRASRLYGAKVWAPTENNFTRIANYDGIGSVLPKASDTQGVAKDADLPSAVDYDKLENVQFGRLSGIAEKEGLQDAVNHYEDPNLKGIKFADKISNSVVLGGQAKATDFYFARGNKPTELDKMKALKSGTIVYHGQALTYGVDNSYHGPQSEKDKKDSQGSVPNSVKTTAQGGVRPTLLGGRGNFVVARFAPDQGKVDGSVYNVWNIADISPAYDNTGVLKGYRLLTKAGPKPEFNDAEITDCSSGSVCVETLNATAYANVHGYTDNLISFSGAVNGNKIEGDAYRYDGEEGKFAGAFFGDGATEMAGVISSAVKYGKQPNDKWGAVFGAKTLKGPDPVEGNKVPGIPTGPKPLGWSLERK